MNARIEPRLDLEEALILLGTPELIHALPDPLFVYDSNGQFVQVNDKACASVGYTREELLGLNVVDLERSLDLESARAGRNELRPGDTRVAYGCHRRKDGSLFPVEVHCGLLKRNGASLYFASVRDMSRRRRSADSAQGLMARYRADVDLQAVMDQLPAMIGYWNSELFCEFANQAYMDWFGLSADRTIGMRMPELVGKKLYQLNAAHVNQALQGNKQRFERRLSSKDGKSRMVDVQYIPDTDAHGVTRGFFVLVTDITEMHNSFERNRELTRRLESVREDERRAIARTLHEGIAQDLFAIKLTLDRLQQGADDPAAIRDAVKTLHPVILKCMADARHIADNLRPTAITHLRIAEAIREHARYFSSISGLKITVSERAGFPALNEETQLILFRAAQEALTNVARHAQASKVDVTLSADAHFVQMEIVDDGIGIAPESRTKSASLGLLGIQEQFEAQGGGLVLERIKPSGTRFLAHLPRINACRLAGEPTGDNASAVASR